jgi:hypothetical protein
MWPSSGFRSNSLQQSQQSLTVPALLLAQCAVLQLQPMHIGTIVTLCISRDHYRANLRVIACYGRRNRSEGANPVRSYGTGHEAERGRALPELKHAALIPKERFSRGFRSMCVANGCFTGGLSRPIHHARRPGRIETNADALPHQRLLRTLAATQLRQKGHAIHRSRAAIDGNGNGPAICSIAPALLRARRLSETIWLFDCIRPVTTALWAAGRGPHLPSVAANMRSSNNGGRPRAAKRVHPACR